MAQRKAAAVSMEKALAERARERAHALGFSTFSAYVVQLIRQDLQHRGGMMLSESPTPEAPQHKGAEAKKIKKKSSS